MKQIIPSRYTGQTDERHIYSGGFPNLVNLSNYDRKRGITIPLEITEDLAYLCGTFAGDGSINNRKNKSEYSLKVVGNPKDEKEFYHQVIGPKFEKVFGIFPQMKYHDSKTTYGFSIYSKSVYNYLTKSIGLPFGIKYSYLKIPEIFRKEEKLMIAFIRGVFDTDGCISFKKKYRSYPYYPVISLTSKSENFIRDVASILKSLNFKIVTSYNNKIWDYRAKQGFTIINRIELNGEDNLRLWIDKIGFYSPKHLEKIIKNKQYKEI